MEWRVVSRSTAAPGMVQSERRPEKYVKVQRDLCDYNRIFLGEQWELRTVRVKYYRALNRRKRNVDRKSNKE